MVQLDKCAWCGREKYPNQLTDSEHHGGKVCADCRADHGPDHVDGELLVGHSVQRGGWCVYMQADDGDCDILRGPFGSREEADASLEKLLS